ncbi:NAD(P)H-dependent oxidoreductase subunit E [Pelotomaculum terephthalicicum JT]|uniref:NADH-quinone oxidoreductase subunit NuoE family protein n=1 Tax=Pelotomaculum TaxID=191373 RepID=UPI0009D00BD8|nr:MULTISPECIES: NAD(P)H-dependent oxidoreductase subunit E [Pelotomaculum]MCG9967205.1 NAD(P)H-dependent oxidoreductase subunit E [Pelotomaculum terephthalicicum JT]OPX86962.1 MAG: NADP-reducing hydrogenase subunit HndA [Pelotomaculum sp. PtaB.Bin117]OPY61553.1 MAG: NADP-reducing hydrogenase subunit HndA [Pelotomaculum sp. PtaU1.Bin065]
MEAAVTKCRCDLDAELGRVIARHEGKKDDLIEILYWVQKNYGYVPKDVQLIIADKMDVPLSAINGVITFYHFFSSKPKGKYEISLCNGTACHLRGAPQVLARFEKELGIKPHDTTGDNMFSLGLIRCLGACAVAPNITINSEPRARMEPDLVPEIINELKEKE